MADSDRDEINRRFAELIGAEFGTSAAGKLDTAGSDQPTAAEPTQARPFEAAGPPKAPEPRPRDRADDRSGEGSGDGAGTDFLDLEFEDEVDYRAGQPIGAPRSHLSSFGIALIAIGLLLSTAGLFTSSLPRAVNWLAGLAWVLGLALLLAQALTRPDDPDGPHSRV